LRDERTTGARGGCAVITSIIVSSCSCNIVNERPSFKGAMNLKKTKAAKKVQRREWTKANLKELKAHSKARTSVDKISKSDQANGWRASP